MNPSLKENCRQWIVCLALIMGLFSANDCRSQTNAYWDVNGTTNGQGGSGSFSSSAIYWTTNSVNATAPTGGPTGWGGGYLPS
jgi:hypothetical protein